MGIDMFPNSLFGGRHPGDALDEPTDSFSEIIFKVSAFWSVIWTCCV